MTTKKIPEPIRDALHVIGWSLFWIIVIIGVFLLFKEVILLNLLFHF